LSPLLFLPPLQFSHVLKRCGWRITTGCTYVIQPQTFLNQQCILFLSDTSPQRPHRLQSVGRPRLFP
jgi:hypothetical protein